MNNNYTVTRFNDYTIKTMNQTFHLPRFLSLLRLEFTEQGRRNLLTLALLVVALLVMMLPITFFDSFKPIFTMPPTLALLMVVLFGGSLFTIQLFGKYGPPEMAIPALMVPASSLEKFLSALLVQVLFAVLLMAVYLYLQDWTIEYANSKMPEGGDEYQQYKKIPAGPLRYLIALYVVIQGLTFCGSLYFSKSAYIKTLVVFAVVAVTLTVVNLGLANLFTHNPTSLVSFPLAGWWQFSDEKFGFHNITVAESIQNLILAVPVVTLVGLWVTTYVRLKEKEV